MSYNMNIFTAAITKLFPNYTFIGTIKFVTDNHNMSIILSSYCTRSFIVQLLVFTDLESLINYNSSKKIVIMAVAGSSRSFSVSV